MPRAFSDRERELIRAKLRAVGAEAFCNFGLRRTSVDELVKAAGISKGAFYLFYESKEALLLELLEQLEQELQTALLHKVLTADLTPRDSLELLVRETLTMRAAHPLLRRISGDDLEQLLRRVEPERARALRKKDVEATSRWLHYWRSRGAVIVLDAEVLAGLRRALVFVSLHHDEIGTDVYPRVLDTLVQGVLAAALYEPVEEREQQAPGPERRTLGDRRPRSLESRLQD